MKIMKLYDKHAYQILLTILPTLAGLFILNTVWNLRLSEFLLSTVVLIWIILMRTLDCNKSLIVVRVVIVSLLVLLVLLVVYKIGPLIELKDKLHLVASGKLPRSELSVFELLVINFIQILIFSLPLYIIQKYKISRLIFACLLLVLLIVIATQGGMYHLYAISLALIYIFLVLAEVLIAKYVSHRKINSSRIMVYLAPLVLVYILMVTYMPVSNKPVTIHETIATGVKDTVTKWYKQIRYIFSSDKGEYGLGMMGYSEDADFGGINEGEEKVCLNVFSTSPLGQPVYLRGNWKNIYSGTGWSEDVKRTDTYYRFGEDMLDWNELLYAMYRYDGLKSMEDLVRIDNIDITYKDIETSSIFLPARSINIKSERELDFKTPENVNYGGLVGEGFSYNFSLLKLNYNSPKWEEFINKEQNYTYSSDGSSDLGPYRSAVREHMISIGLHGDFTTEDTLAKRAAYIKEEYTQLPEELPERVYNLTKKITQGCDTPLEQCKAIEKYLRTYRYTLQPKKMPEGNDLVDWFLFESKEGYCTNFATAMAVMVRTLGLPSRYDQGFVVKTGFRPNSSSEGKSTDAHAWVEVYIEGLGWMNYDPTPASGTGLNVAYRWDSKVVMQRPSNTGDGKSDQLIDMSDVYNYHELMAKENAIALEEEAQNKKLLGIIMYLMVTLVILGILLISGYIIIKIMRNTAAWKKLSTNNKLHAAMIQIFFLMDAFNLPIEDNETLHQYCNRVKRALEDEELSITEIESIYTSVRYSNKEVSTKELDKVIQFRDKQLKVLRKNRNLYSYYRIWLEYSMMTIK